MLLANRGVRGAIRRFLRIRTPRKNARHGPAATRRETALEAFSIKSGAKLLRQEARYSIFRRRSAIGDTRRNPVVTGRFDLLGEVLLLEAEQRIHDL